MKDQIRVSRFPSELFRLKFFGVHWFVLLDDDTFFVVDNLAQVRPQVLDKHGFRGCWDCTELLTCGSARETTGLGGTITYGELQACMAELGVPLTLDRGFHQMDVRGDAIGLLDSHPTTPLVSLHHLDTDGLDSNYFKRTGTGSCEDRDPLSRLEIIRVRKQRSQYRGCVIMSKTCDSTRKLLRGQRVPEQGSLLGSPGGGPATFGVVLSVTYRTHPAPAAVTNVHHEVSANDSSSLRDFIAEYARLMPSTADKGYGGGFVALPNGGHLNYVLPGGNQSTAQQDWQPLVDFAASHPGLKVLQRIATFPNFYAFFNATLCKNAVHGILASKLLPRSLFVNCLDAIADAYMGILTRNSSNGARNFILTMGVGGGAGALGDEHSAALNPAWRKALWHTVIQAVWDDNASDDVIQHKFAGITSANQVFRDLALESGSYMNEGDYNKPDWQTLFFGALREAWRDQGTGKLVFCIFMLEVQGDAKLISNLPFL
ncbi:hypothetical protein SELMODRAFT_425534 [Selaginella moellendorffii]|uniref:Uncharacterized protein n=1 Tax=Selaginella moellendorffii TaxID=88036 RepID=D8STE9_SELML|nr:hypothetical protein SELMODRAFT_425534 [Selaginella moellendorffii]